MFKSLVVHSPRRTKTYTRQPKIMLKLSSGLHQISTAKGHFFQHINFIKFDIANKFKYESNSSLTDTHCFLLVSQDVISNCGNFIYGQPKALADMLSVGQTFCFLKGILPDVELRALLKVSKCNFLHIF